MRSSPQKCLACGGALEDGFIVDNSHAQRLAAEWAAGQPKYGFFGTLRLPDRVFTIQAFRCVRCGLLMQYADDSESA